MLENNFAKNPFDAYTWTVLGTFVKSEELENWYASLDPLSKLRIRLFEIIKLTWVYKKT